MRDQQNGYISLPVQKVNTLYWFMVAELIIVGGSHTKQLFG